MTVAAREARATTVLPLLLLLVLGVAALARAIAVTAASGSGTGRRVAEFAGDILLCLCMVVAAAALLGLSRLVGQALADRSGGRLSWLMLAAVVLSACGCLSRLGEGTAPLWPEIAVGATGLLALPAVAYFSGRLEWPGEGWRWSPQAPRRGIVAVVVMAVTVLVAASIALVRTAVAAAGGIAPSPGYASALVVCLLAVFAHWSTTGADRDPRSTRQLVPPLLLVAVVVCWWDLLAGLLWLAGALGVMTQLYGHRNRRAQVTAVVMYLAGFVIVGALAVVGRRALDGERASSGHGRDNAYLEVVHGLGFGGAVLAWLAAVGLAVVALVLVLLVGWRLRMQPRNGIFGNWAVGATCALGAQAVLPLIPWLDADRDSVIGPPLLTPDGASFLVTAITVGLILGATSHRNRAGAGGTDTDPPTGGRP
jgi:hypothetical protein